MLALGILWKENAISLKIKWALYERVMTPTVVYDFEIGLLNVQEKRKLEEVFHMMCGINVCGIRRSENVRKSLIRERDGCEFNIVKGVEHNMLKWFGLERTEEEKLIKSECQSGRGR